MKLQLALDLLDQRRAREIVVAPAPHVDIIEVGTSLLKLAGIGFVNELSRLAPGRPIFVDAKIIDGPAREAELRGRAGADAYSMLAVATDTAVRTVLDRAAADGAEVVFDLQSHPDPIIRRAEQLQ